MQGTYTKYVLATLCSQFLNRRNKVANVKESCFAVDASGLVRGLRVEKRYFEFKVVQRNELLISVKAKAKEYIELLF